MKSLLEILKLSSDFLEKQGIESPRKEAEILLSDFLGLKRLDLYLQFDRPFQEKELETFRGRLKRRGKGEPSQYIHGKMEFYGLDLGVSPAALIPRQETEILVDKIVKSLEGIDLEGKSFLDLCTGSGCIGLAIKKKFPSLSLILSDISPNALNLARQNAVKNGLDVEFLEGDFLETLGERKVSFIACNPPYVTEEEFFALSSEVKNYEPKMALVAKEQGLNFYKRLARGLPAHLLPGGRAWLEIGSSQGASVLALFQESPFKCAQLEKDWSSHDRFISLEMD